MNHLEFARAESAALNADGEWLAWTVQVENLIGRDLDGDNNTDGYSIDFCYDLYQAGHTPDDAAELIKESIAAPVQISREELRAYKDLVEADRACDAAKAARDEAVRWKRNRMGSAPWEDQLHDEHPAQVAYIEAWRARAAALEKFS